MSTIDADYARADDVFTALLLVGAEIPEEVDTDALGDLVANIFTEHRLAAPARNWRPIETAPKDGTVILAWSVGQSEYSETQLIFWYDDPDYPEEPPYWCVNYEGYSDLVPTHWMPLPGAPA